MQVVQEKEVTLPWGKVALKCWNASSLPPVLVVHGVNSNAGTFDRLIPLLPNENYYVCVDLPGHGHSDHFPKCIPINLSFHVMALEMIARDFGWESYSLMGHSFGAFLLLILAALEGPKVDKLILIDMAIMNNLMPGDLFFHQMKKDFYLQFDLIKKCSMSVSSQNEALIGVISQPLGPEKETSAMNILARDIKTTNKGLLLTSDPRKLIFLKLDLTTDGFLSILRKASKAWPVLQLLANDGPIWEVYQSMDFYVDVKENLSKNHPLSRCVVINGKHAVHTDNPETIAPAIQSFLLDTKNWTKKNSKL